MRKKLTVLTCAAAMAIAPVAFGHDNAQATHRIGHFLGGLAVGAIIGGAIAQQRPRYYAPAPVYNGYPQAHYSWCASKYRSYHAPSNSFQPYGPNPRRPCISPYM